MLLQPSCLFLTKSAYQRNDWDGTDGDEGIRRWLEADGNGEKLMVTVASEANDDGSRWRVDGAGDGYVQKEKNKKMVRWLDEEEE